MQQGAGQQLPAADAPGGGVLQPAVGGSVLMPAVGVPAAGEPAVLPAGTTAYWDDVRRALAQQQANQQQREVVAQQGQQTVQLAYGMVQSLQDLLQSAQASLQPLGQALQGTAFALQQTAVADDSRQLRQAVEAAMANELRRRQGLLQELLALKAGMLLSDAAPKGLHPLSRLASVSAPARDALQPHFWRLVVVSVRLSVTHALTCTSVSTGSVSSLMPSSFHACLERRVICCVWSFFRIAAGPAVPRPVRDATQYTPWVAPTVPPVLQPDALQELQQVAELNPCIVEISKLNRLLNGDREAALDLLQQASRRPQVCQQMLAVAEGVQWHGCMSCACGHVLMYLGCDCACNVQWVWRELCGLNEAVR
jgi:hypothetical protein